MTAMAVMTKPDTYYTPSRVRALCRLYPYLTNSRPPADPETRALVRRGFGPGTWQEEAACKRADIWNALRWLQEQSWQTSYCVRACLIVGVAQRHAANYLNRETGQNVWYQRQVSRTIDRGVTAMAQYLRGEVDEFV